MDFMPLRNDQQHGDWIPVATGMCRVAFLIAAGVFFLVGVAGILLPGLPTTPFMLLTSYFLLRSSPSLNKRLLHSRFLGPILQDWHERRGIRPAVKLRAALLVVVLLSVSTYFGNLPLVPTSVILALGGVGLTVIYYLPTIPTEIPTGQPQEKLSHGKKRPLLIERIEQQPAE